ncbi:MAG: RES family NAD+ phosphorylase [Thalassobaculaceae bacterium]
MTVSAPLSRVAWTRYHQLIATAYPPFDLVGDISDPADWPLPNKAEARINASPAETIGRTDLIPPTCRVGGPGISYAMAPFTHCTPDMSGLFHDDSSGAFYGAADFETAVTETVHHTARFLAATDKVPGWVAEKRKLVGAINAELLFSPSFQGGHARSGRPNAYGRPDAYQLSTRAGRIRKGAE